MEDSDIKGNNIKGMQKLIYKYIENSIDDRDFERITPINEGFSWPRCLFFH